MSKEELLAIVSKAEEEKRALTDEEKALLANAIETRASEESTSGETEEAREDTTSGETEDRADEATSEETSGETEERADEQPTSGETQEEATDETRNITNKVINNKKMEKRFNLMAELRNALETGKKIQLGEQRAYSVTAEGEDVVQTDIYDIWAPLHAKNVLTDLGVRTITGIKNNVQIPLMSKVTCGFAGELGAAADGSGSFTNKKLTPHRITAKYPISLELLAQDSIGVENAIRSEISKALYSKLEETILSADKGTDDKPEGMFYNVSATTVTDFAGICNLEASLETANVEGTIKYALSPSAKAGLRNMAKSTKSTQLVMEGGEIDGTPALSTSNIAGKNFVVGDWSNMVLATWDNVSIDVVRDTASLENGVVTVVVNAFCDGKIIRPEGFAYGKIA